MLQYDITILFNLLTIYTITVLLFIQKCSTSKKYYTVYPNAVAICRTLFCYLISALVSYFIRINFLFTQNGFAFYKFNYSKIYPIIIPIPYLLNIDISCAIR